MNPPTHRLLLFAHGAGAGISHPWMQRWTKLLAPLGRVVPFEYPYMKQGRKAPDRLPKLIEAHRAALAEHRKDAAQTVLIGKSMGSRVGCHLSLEEPVDAVVCMGYPLVGMSKKSPVRREVLEQMKTPVLFVQGSRDRMGPLDLFDEVRTAMRADSALHVVEGGNHSLEVGKRALAAQDRTQDDVDAEILAAITDFVEDKANAGSA